MINKRYNAHKTHSLFIGRWQPFHRGHKFLIDQALSDGKNVCVAIRNTEISEKNPYTVEQRMEMFRRVYGNQIKIIEIPDIESINIGRKVGYAVNRIDPPKEIGQISGTNVRAGKDTNIPSEVAEYINLLNTTFWFTGLPCSGKTTISKRLEEELINRGYRAVSLDGDDVRTKLNEDLGFSYEDRTENIRRIAHVSELFNRNGNLVIASFVSPLNKIRGMARKIIPNFKLIYIKCRLEECEKRDVKGMYAKARKGEIKNFTGISAPFEEPETPDLVLDTELLGLEDCVNKILKELKIDY